MSTPNAQTSTERLYGLVQAEAAEKPKVALDTCCVQYYISSPPIKPWADFLDPVFQAGIEGKIELYVSTVVVSELLTHLHFRHRHNAGYDPELDLLAIMNRHFQVLDVNGDVARAAGRLRGNYAPGDKISLKTPDALIGATSLANGHTLFITNDAQLANALPKSNSIYLRDVALDWLASNFPGPCFDEKAPVQPSKYGIGLPPGHSKTFLELGCIQTEPSAKLKRIIHDAQIVASALSEPCVFFVLSEKDGRRVETREVLFWYKRLKEVRTTKKIIQRLYDHIGYSRRLGIASRAKSLIHGLLFTSLSLEKSRQTQPSFASKSEHQKDADAWNAYLDLWRTYRLCLDLPQMTWLHCEDESVRLMDASATFRFLEHAGNILGWSSEQ